MAGQLTRRDYGVGLAAVVLVLLVLLLQYAGNFYAIQLTRISKEAELGRHLEDLGSLAGVMLRSPALALDGLAADCQWEILLRQQGGQQAPAADAIYRASLTTEMTAPLTEFAGQTRLRQVVVLTRDGRVLLDTLQGEPLLQTYLFWPIDRLETQQALQGRLASTPAYTAGDANYKRTYVPIFSRALARTDDAAAAEPEVDAVLCLVAGRTYLAEIGLLARHLRRASAVVTLLMALIGLLILRLIRRQRRTERLAAENDRLAALGRLAAGFAHELRNPLGIIRAFTEDLQQVLRRSGGEAEALEACDDIVEEVDRMNRLVGQFLGYSRGRPPEPGTGQASALEAIESVIGIVRPSAEKQGVTLRIEHAPFARADVLCWQVRLESGPLRQVLINLLLNAVEISPRGGLIRIGIEVQSRRVRLSISDQGPGIQAQDRARIFEPFYTTREGGSGLGLAISRQIATAAAGALEVGPDPPGGGACFLLTLPRAADAPAVNRPDSADAPAPPEPQPAARGEG